MDFVRQLSIFVAVAHAGSFARAAESLGMTRPAVTAAINELEKAVGARLLQRTTRRTSLTGEGSELLARSAGVLEAVDAAKNLFGGPSHAPRGRLRVDMPVALAGPIVVPALPDFRAKYPNVDLILGVSDQLVDLVADAVDCVLRIGPLTDSSLVGRTVAEMTMVVCASPEYLASRGVPKTIGDLQSHVAVNYFSGKHSRPMGWTLPPDVPGSAVRVPSAILVNDTDSFVGCALAGMGLIQVPALFVAEHLESGRLVQVLPRDLEVVWPMSVLYPNRQYLAPQVRAFVDWIAELIRSKPQRWLRPV